MTQEKINRINELAKKSRTPEGLTEAERSEQAALRQEYREGIVRNLRSQLDNVEIVDEKAVEQALEKEEKIK